MLFFLNCISLVSIFFYNRGLEFIREFLREICSGGPDLSECASNAYGRTLKKYHGWVVRGVFAVSFIHLITMSEDKHAYSNVLPACSMICLWYTSVFILKH